MGRQGRQRGPASFPRKRESTTSRIFRHSRTNGNTRLAPGPCVIPAQAGIQERSASPGRPGLDTSDRRGRPGTAQGHPAGDRNVQRNRGDPEDHPGWGVAANPWPARRAILNGACAESVCR